MKITSAHAIAFVALVASLGGGYAIAHNGDTDKIHFCIANEGGAVRAVQPDKTCNAGETPQDVRIQNVAYQEATSGPATYPANKSRMVSKQLIVPAAGDTFLLSGKLVVSKGKGTRTGDVTCQLEPTDNTPADKVVATVRPGQSVPMAFEDYGKTDGRPGQTAAVEISCRSAGSRFTVRYVKVTAMPLNTVSKGVPVA